MPIRTSVSEECNLYHYQQRYLCCCCYGFVNIIV